MERCRRLADLLAVAAGELLADVLDHLPGLGDDLQRLGDVLAQLRQPRAAAAGAGGRPRHDHPLARQMLGEGFAGRSLAGERRHRRRLGRGDFGGEFVLGGRCLQFLQLQFQLLHKPGGALRARAIAIPIELRDLQLEMGDQGLVVGLLSPGGRDLGARHDQRRLQRVEIVWQRFRGGIHDPDEIIKCAIWDALFYASGQLFSAYPALRGRQVCCGFRQSIASSK